MCLSLGKICGFDPKAYREALPRSEWRSLDYFPKIDIIAWCIVCMVAACILIAVLGISCSHRVCHMRSLLLSMQFFLAC